MFSAILCIGTWPGPSIITCTSCFQATCVSSPSVSSSANCAASFASAMQPGRRPSPSENDTSYFFISAQMRSNSVYRKFSSWWYRHHFAMIEPPRETMPVTRSRGQRHVTQQHAGVDREVVDALLRLLLQRLDEDVDVELLGLALTFSSAW